MSSPIFPSYQIRRPFLPESTKAIVPQSPTQSQF
jgi:hypothetical protein